jgi:L-ascorbate metabolism protein UlaG (beta-lactamase superfamily)
VPPAPHTPNPGGWPDNAITLGWLGHATVLINFYGVRVLTDPALFPRTSDLLPRRRYASVRELRWGQSVRIDTPRGDLHVRALEVKHWGARLRRDTHRGYNAYILEREGRALLFGGDTAMTPLFTSYRRYGPYDAAIMPIGAYDPYVHNHCTPEQAVAMADTAGARLFVPVHHKSFQLSRESFHEPIERAQAALAAEPDRLAVKDIGETARVS